MKNPFYKASKILALLSFFFVIIFVVNSEAGMQQVTISPTESTVSKNKAQKLKLSYDVIDGVKLTTGLGIRIHYNSKIIDSLMLESIYQKGLLAQDKIPQEDVHDFDNDPLTDKYIGVAWMDIKGNWPDSTNLPLELGEILLKINLKTILTQTSVNITLSGAAANYAFKAQSAVIKIR